MSDGRHVVTKPALATQVAVLVIAAIVCGGIANASRADGIPWIGQWDRRVEALALRAGIPIVGLMWVKEISESVGGMVLDARSAEAYAAGHVPGALSLPRGAFYETLAGIEPLLSRDEPVVTYCSGPDCDDALAIAQWLREQGFTRVSLFAEGFAAWQAAGYPEEAGKSQGE